RRSGGEGGSSAIDAAAAMAKILEQGLVEASALEPWAESGIPDTVAAIGRGERRGGKAVLVSFSPHSATLATLGGLAAAQRAVAESGFDGHLLIVAPQWPAGARRLLSRIGDAPYSVEPVVATALSEGHVVVEPEPAPCLLSTGPHQVAARLGSSEARSAFTRAALALEGLAAKHGGSVRFGTDRLELVVMTRRVAEIRAQDDKAVLEVQIGGRSTTPLTQADLAGALDGLEGQLRRRLNDRKVREGEDGLRSRVIAQLASGSELRSLRPWPQPGAEVDDVDGVAVNAEGEPVIIAVRQELEWTALGAVLEAIEPLGALSPILFADVAPPLRLGSPRLLLAAERFADGLERVLAALTVPYELRSVSGVAGPAVDLVPQSRGEGAESRSPRRGRRRGGRSGAGRTEAREESETTEGDEEARRPAVPEGPRADREAAARADEGAGEGRAEETAESDEGSRRRGRRRRRPRGGRGAAEGAESESTSSPREGRESEEGRRGGEGGRRSQARFEEVSLLDLDEGPGGEPEETRRSGSEGEEPEARSEGRRRRPRRRGRRGTPSGGDEESGDGSEGREEGARSDRGSRSSETPSESRVEEDDLVDSDDLEEILARLAGDVPDFESSESEELSYDDEEEGEEDETHAQRRDREQRRQARKEGSGNGDRDRPAPRRRSAIVVHADRDSLFAALLLARDIRQLDGLWVYPQSELMTFFRSVATDLREDTPMFVVGFQPSPARDVIQASSLYRGRLAWFDRHVWPPEDLMALRESLGRDAVHGGEDIDSTLPLVLETCSRRSRFSDKLVDLATGRFTQHDFERWGRLWWWRLGEIARKSGDIRADVAPLLSGRPSDLAKEASRVEVPPPPAEVAYVAEHDFRLVHFGGHVMVVVPVEGSADVHLVARIARERYGASLSLAYRVGEETLTFCGDEVSGKRALDYLAVAEHLVEKLEWVDPRPDADHVARFRIRALGDHPERLEELIGEIAMGRSLLER
ncbi:MAG: hypothetical protein ACX98W_09195, partial [bacterium]